jgi:hypothetical protein
MTVAILKNRGNARHTTRLQRAWQTASKAQQAAELALISGKRRDALAALVQARNAKADVEAAWKLALTEATNTHNSNKD